MKTLNLTSYWILPLMLLILTVGMTGCSSSGPTSPTDDSTDPPEDNDGAKNSRKSVALAVDMERMPSVEGPTDLRAFMADYARTGCQINLTWTDNSVNENGFSIERRTRHNDWEVIGSVDAGITSYRDSLLDPYQLYYYRVRAFVSTIYSPYSNIANAIVLSVMAEDQGVKY